VEEIIPDFLSSMIIRSAFLRTRTDNAGRVSRASHSM
jgi:hypothetical protein